MFKGRIMALKFIEVIDLTTDKNEGRFRRVSLAHGGRNHALGDLRVVGGLSHSTDITFSYDEAVKLRDFLQTEIIDRHEDTT
jgi:hypothetical protein